MNCLAQHHWHKNKKMKTRSNTVLIIGGSAGIGYEIAKRFDAAGNTVIITGRNEERLRKAAATMGNAVAIKADVSSVDDTDRLINLLTNEFPALNVVINNAAAANIKPLLELNDEALNDIAHEINTNYLSIIRWNAKVLPLLQKQSEAAIVNVSSVVAYVPGFLATYSASKAALHSYTQSLRQELSLGYPNVKVFELFPPLVNTEFSRPIGGEKGIPPQQVADEFIAGFANDTYEIRVGMTEQLYRLFLSSPEQAFAAMHSKDRATEHA